jgi:hypothetical protein
MQIVAVIDHAGHFCGKADRRTLQEASGKADRPGVDSLLRLCVRRLLRFWWRIVPMRARFGFAHVSFAHPPGTAEWPGAAQPMRQAKAAGVIRSICSSANSYI